MCNKFSEKDLSLFIDDALDNDKREMLKSHLLNCQSCTEKFDSLIKVKDVLGSFIPLKAPPGFASEIKSRINAPSKRKSPFSLPYITVGSAVATIAVIALVFNITIHRPHKYGQPDSLPSQEAVLGHSNLYEGAALEEKEVSADDFRESKKLKAFAPSVSKTTKSKKAHIKISLLNIDVASNISQKKKQDITGYRQETRAIVRERRVTNALPIPGKQKVEAPQPKAPYEYDAEKGSVPYLADEDTFNKDSKLLEDHKNKQFNMLKELITNVGGNITTSSNSTHDSAFISFEIKRERYIELQRILEKNFYTTTNFTLNSLPDKNIIFVKVVMNLY